MDSGSLKLFYNACPRVFSVFQSGRQEIRSSEMLTQTEAISGLTEKGVNEPIDFWVMSNKARGKSFSSWKEGESFKRARAPSI